jgi:RNA polymerase sigma-70 factor (ECF subfamily)
VKQTDRVRRAQRGNHEAFVQLIQEYESSMYRVAKAFLKSDIDCADVMQETILKVYKGIRALKEPEYLKTWLIRILINECQRLLKQKAQVIPMADFIEKAYRPDTQQDLEIQEAVQSLEEDLRITVTLFCIEDISLVDIALLLEIPEGTVKSRLYRAREKLAHYWQAGEERTHQYE